ncbi:unnamed protein product [Malus baccata var. baccata]
MGIITDSQNKKKPSSSSTSPCAKLRDTYHNCFIRSFQHKIICEGPMRQGGLRFRMTEIQGLPRHKQLSRFLEAEGNVNSTTTNKNESREDYSGGNSNNGELLRDIEELSKALYFQKPPPKGIMGIVTVCRWYSEKFVKGEWDKEDCVSEWQKYKACLAEHLEDKQLSRFLEAKGNVNSTTTDGG